jgi:hypothetical protein
MISARFISMAMLLAALCAAPAKAILEEKVFRLDANATEARVGRCFELHPDATPGEAGVAQHATALDPACREEP